MKREEFAERLRLVLKAMSISGGRLAADACVDKSLVSRWCSGAVTPSEHNLARLTQTIAARHPGFTMLDWELDLPALAARFGVTVAAPAPLAEAGVPGGFAEWLALPKLREAAFASGGASAALAGFWRTTRPSPEFPGKFVHDHVIMEPTADGPLRFRMGLFSSRVSGWSMAVGDQMFCCATNMVVGSSIFAIFNRVHRPRIDVLDGVTLACMADAGGVPVAAACSNASASCRAIRRPMRRVMRNCSQRIRSRPKDRCRRRSGATCCSMSARPRWLPVAIRC